MDTLITDAQTMDPQYFITITYRPSELMVKPYIQFQQTLFDLRKQLQKSCRYIICPELTIRGIIHYHGIIHIRDRVKWYKSTLPWLKINCGHIDISALKNLEKSLEYMTKDYRIYKEIFNASEIIIKNETQVHTEIPYTERTIIEALDENN